MEAAFGLKKATLSSVIIVGDLAEIRNRPLHNTCQVCQHLSQLGQSADDMRNNKSELCDQFI
jgi:hypothetical protein